MCVRWPAALGGAGSVAFSHTQTIAKLWFRDREETEDYTRLCFPLAWGEEASVDLANGAYATAVAALSDCVFCASEIEFLCIEETPFADLAATPAFAAQWGSLFFVCDDLVNTRCVLDLPAFNATCYLPDGVTIDRAHPDVAALVTALTATGEDAWINPFGAPLRACDAGMRRVVPLTFAEASG